MPVDSLTGASNPYVPGSQLRYAANLTLHRDYDSDIGISQQKPNLNLPKSILNLAESIINVEKGEILFFISRIND